MLFKKGCTTGRPLYIVLLFPDESISFDILQFQDLLGLNYVVCAEKSNSKSLSSITKGFIYVF